MNTIDLRRRRWLLLGATAAVAATLSPRLRAQGTLPQLDEADATASALGYRHSTDSVDAGRYPNHRATQMCNNCKLAQGAAADAWRPCGIFPGKSVNAKGWCAAYAAKT